MANYTQFAPFYDAVMGDRKEATDFLLSLVREHHPKERIIRAVRARFSGVKVIDPDRDQPEKKGERLYFVCKK